MLRIVNEDPSSPIEYSFEIQSILIRRESPFQEILVVETAALGRVMLLDGAIQYCTRDEFFYHEMAAHPALHTHPSPRRVAIIGGGDGGTLREVLKHKEVEHVTVVEIDEAILEVAKEYLPGAREAFADARVGVEIKDGAEFVQIPGNSFDLMIVDAGDYVGFARSLLTEDFFRSAANLLTDKGLLVTQSGSLHFHRSTVIEIQNVLAQVFPKVDLYTTTLPTLPGNWWTYSIGSKGPSPRKPLRNPIPDCRYYDAGTHEHAFLPETLYIHLRDGKLDW